MIKQKVFSGSTVNRVPPKPAASKPRSMGAPAAHTSAIDLNTGPRPFNFTDVPDAISEKGCVSNSVRMKDLPGPTAVRVVGRGSYRINRGPWLKTPSTINEGDLLQLMLKPSDTSGSSRRMRVCVGPYYTDFKVITA